MILKRNHFTHCSRR